MFLVGLCCSSYSFLCSVLWIVDCIFVLFFICHCIYCLSLFDLWILITPLVSSNLLKSFSGEKRVVDRQFLSFYKLT